MSNYNDSHLVSQHINQIAREKNDTCFVNQYQKQSKNNMDWRLYNTRETPCEKKIFKTSHPLYLQHNISPGHVNNCKVNIDSNLTRGQLSFKPVDNLAESVDKSFAFYDLPKSNSNHFNVQQSFQDNNLFMKLATTVPEHPQFHLNASFSRIGVSTRDYSRKNSLYYKNLKKPLNINKTVGSHGRYSKW